MSRLQIVVALIGTTLLPNAHVYGAATDRFAYVNCADQQLDGPLLSCAKLTINPISGDFVIRDTGSKFPPGGCESNVFYCLPGPQIPIAVPRRGYKNTGSWKFLSYSYQKEGVHIPDPYRANQYVDAISVKSNSKEMIITFWYSEKVGVVAIGFPQKRQNSGEVFYLTGDTGIFPQSP